MKDYETQQKWNEITSTNIMAHSRILMNLADRVSELERKLEARESYEREQQERT